ncbi:MULTISPECIES: acyl-CoA dehydrogenase family protein [Streptosporangium]|uniref:Acyl-CoA dehydrogenase n=1 Tax=Streptosporangium brasiliense TaxID=47480 RepID=A0ABT9RH07_9ACTN|nr:acyl-CoA dehydrogenase family protein [Streptosporangium brasiliense]MDP9867650.1 acyl-CoA dehydrogenase [Streptosporangium brasiliense]
MWDFSTEPEFQEKLDWMDAFIRDEVEPLDLAFGGHAYRDMDDRLREIVGPLKQQVKDRGLWACHLGPELGGQGYGQLKLALMNELIGRSGWAPVVFGCQAPDTGNAEIIAMYGTAEQKERYLQPLLDGECFSAYSMTEPHAGADPRLFRCRAVRDASGGWVISGEKYFTSNASSATFLIVMAVTDPEAHPYRRMSMFLVPADTPGVEILRDIGTIGERPGHGAHAHIRYDDVRVPAEALLGEEGGAFAVSQARLGGGRIHHSMRTVAAVKKAFDMMCERVLSRRTHDGLLADKQLVQAAIADSYIQIQQFRLMVLHTAWLIDRSSTREARTQIAACKVAAARVFHDVVYRAMHIHGALGVSNETPLARLWQSAPLMGIMDGPTEVHLASISRRVLRGYSPAEGPWPTEFLPDRVAAARAKYGLPENG